MVIRAMLFFGLSDTSHVGSYCCVFWAWTGGPAHACTHEWSNKEETPQKNMNGVMAGVKLLFH
jgi:hypothetical protein